MALNDVWSLDVSNTAKMKWERIETGGDSPTPRGYHTANLVGNIMIIVGGSDGKDCFSAIWCLDLGVFLALGPMCCHLRPVSRETTVDCIGID